ncbi:MAG: hypothetical protein GF320_03435 [Armatimonadia bacterium]|nr:hypothetical protein [Armatimonadia bacterium]
MRRCAVAVCLVGCLVACVAPPGWAQVAPEIGRITISPSRHWVLADDTDSVTLEINVLTRGGFPVPDGTEVGLTSTAGRLEDTTATTFNGIARVQFYSGGDSDTDAVITAIAHGRRAERAQVISITREEGHTEEGARVARIRAEDYLAFREAGSVVVGYGGVEFEFRRLKITAEHLQFRVFPPYQLKAENAVVSNGEQQLEAKNLYVEFRANDTRGAAFLQEPEARAMSFVDDGFTEGNWWAPEDKFQMWDLDESTIVIKCRRVLLHPQDKLTLEHARIYYDGFHVLTMSAQVIELGGAMSGGSAFPQILGFTYPGGLFVDYPYYFATGEHFTGAVRLRHGSPAGSFYGRTGWYADIEAEWESDDGDGGSLLVDGLGQRDWGARASHHQVLGSDTQTGVSVAWPQHRYVSAYGNAYKPMTSGSQMVTANWFGGGGLEESWSLDWTRRLSPADVGAFNLGYAFDLGLERDVWSGQPYGRAGVSGSLRPQKAWDLVGNLTLSPRASGEIEQRTNGELEWSTVVGVDAALRFSRTGSLSVGYDIGERAGGRFLNGTRHTLRARLHYFSTGSRPLSLVANAVHDIDSGRFTTYGYASWEFEPKWTLTLVGTMSRTARYTFEDYTFGVGRRLGQTEARLAYSTSRDRIEFEFSRLTSAF